MGSCGILALSPIYLPLHASLGLRIPSCVLVYFCALDAMAMQQLACALVDDIGRDLCVVLAANASSSCLDSTKSLLDCH